jgi:hypothetical protein
VLNGCFRTPACAHHHSKTGHRRPCYRPKSCAARISIYEFAAISTSFTATSISLQPYSRLYPSLCGRIHSHIHLFAVFTATSISLPYSRIYPSRCGRFRGHIHLVAAVFTAISISLRPCSRLYLSRCVSVHVIHGHIHLFAAVFTAIFILLRPYLRINGCCES